MKLDVDAGELEAICLAQEIKAATVLMDDRAGRKAAISCGLAVIGTIGLLEQAAARGFLELPQAMERLQQTNARLDPELIQAPSNETRRGNSSGQEQASGSIRDYSRNSRQLCIRVHPRPSVVELPLFESRARHNSDTENGPISLRPSRQPLTQTDTSFLAHRCPQMQESRCKHRRIRVS